MNLKNSDVFGGGKRIPFYSANFKRKMKTKGKYLRTCTGKRRKNGRSSEDEKNPRSVVSTKGGAGGFGGGKI